MASSVWKGHLTFGLVSFPVRLFSAARAVTVSFNQLHEPDNSRIKQMIYCQAEDKPISRNEIVSMVFLRKRPASRRSTGCRCGLPEKHARRPVVGHG